MSLIFTLPYLASILFSAVMAGVYRKQLHSRHLRILIPYLLYVFIQETTLVTINQLYHTASNAVVYNIYRPISAVVFFWIYYHIPFMEPLRKLMIWLTLAYLGFTLANYFFLESIVTTSSYLTLARGFVITFYGILFLFRFFLPG
ncbi:MAG: hypothetical protein WDO71_20515 [Bacteroidota bacterium]